MAPKRDVEGMGPPEIKYGESLCFVQHVASGLWITYAAPDPKALRLGVLKKKVGTWKGTVRCACLRLQEFEDGTERNSQAERETEIEKDGKQERGIYIVNMCEKKRGRNAETGKVRDKKYGERKIEKDGDRETEMEKTERDKQTENNIQELNEHPSCFGCVCGKTGQLYRPVPYRPSAQK